MGENFLVYVLKFSLHAELWLVVGWFFLMLAGHIGNVLSNRKSNDFESTKNQYARRQLFERLNRLVMPERRARMAIGVFLVGLSIQFAGRELLHWLGRQNLRKFIAVHENTMDINVRGRHVNDTRLVTVLSSTEFAFRHHSHSTERIPIALVGRTGEQIKLVLGKDSAKSNEYWVYFQPYGMSDHDPIGATYTFLLQR